MSTLRQRVAYREILDKRHQEHQIRAYGMVPIAARHPGHCPCGQTVPGPYGRGTQACPFGPGDKIVKFRGAWWNMICVDRVTQDEFKASAKFVLEEVFANGKTWAKAWTNDPVEAENWRRNLSDDERIIDRGEN
jgi:hypothetical protein